MQMRRFCRFASCRTKELYPNNIKLDNNSGWIPSRGAFPIHFHFLNRTFSFRKPKTTNYFLFGPLISSHLNKLPKNEEEVCVTLIPKLNFKCFNLSPHDPLKFFNETFYELGFMFVFHIHISFSEQQIHIAIFNQFMERKQLSFFFLCLFLRFLSFCFVVTSIFFRKLPKVEYFFTLAFFMENWSKTSRWVHFWDSSGRLWIH